MCGRFFESPLPRCSAPQNGGYRVRGTKREEALLMRENKPQGHTSEKVSRCEIDHLFDGAACVEAAKEQVDSLLLCERHALEAKLEGQISCWEGMLFHIDLWSREASRREREDVVALLKDQRIEATSARRRAYADLDVLRKSGTPREHREYQEPPTTTTTTRDSLLLLLP